MVRPGVVTRQYPTPGAAAQMPNLWKLDNVVRGTLTFVPGLYAWRAKHASTGGSTSARYCYSVWLRHLVTLAPYGFRPDNAHVAELGRSEEHTSELQSLRHLVCRLL